jgi:hypothetical protein
MPDATQFQFNIPSVPRAYEKFLVPRVFEPWAMLLLDAVEPRAGEFVLDVAAGPGTVARLAAVRVGVRGRVLATDIAQPIILQKPRRYYRNQLKLTISSLLPHRFRVHRQHSMSCCVSRVCSSFLTVLAR